ncbi:LysR family transcriptional regulator [Comamonas testosteroni]|uniref:LysR family transcriptional regulator n=1 Tax=Comamonas testosteroni TaxID=285 RepID=A0A096GWV4_COMTE|nr:MULTISPECIES: LysR family transcriptional regulator [Comamonas]KGH29645.1 LysR family transcriptional regulator [Comamonas testosteroni]KOC24326.1 LysR family transcriptional regulator [Comamonas testosteroni]KWT67886.1 Transcriptional regulator, LysR family [Comamonas testosteroni]MDN5507385.1 LysR family transcriptional regulator [Comamonas sp.]MDN5538708.1 LysR family transcriptional regulator [Comamonas sp.]
MVDLNDMLYFVEVVERGGFAAAGRALGIPKSRLSRRVAELEAHLGVRLLQRTTRKLSLTQVGETFLRHGQAMRDAALAASDAVAEVQTEPRGTIRVTCPVTLAQTVLGELMPEFLERCPLVQVEMQVTNRPVNLVEEGVDVALRVRATLEDSGSMVVKRLDSSRQILVASPDLLQRQGTPRSLEDLQLLDSMAMAAVDGHSSLLLVGPEGKEHRLQLQPRYVVDDLLTLKFAALAGSGMCWLPDYMCQDELTRGTLVQLLPQWAPPRGIVHAVFPSRRGLAPAVRHFLDFLGERMPGSSISAAQKAASASALH